MVPYVITADQLLLSQGPRGVNICRNKGAFRMLIILLRLFGIELAFSHSVLKLRI